TLANMTREWSAYLMDIGVAYKEDTDHVVAVMRRVAEELRQDPGIGFPSPQHSIRVGEASKPLPVLLTQASGPGPSE
ncbi:MAG: hypothetical protein ACREJ1_05005, partial [Candidatus Methylomirabilales bacterium]